MVVPRGEVEQTTECCEEHQDLLSAVSPAQEVGLRGVLGWENTKVGGCFLGRWEGGSQQGPEKHLLPPEREQGGGCSGMG